MIVEIPRKPFAPRVAEENGSVKIPVPIVLWNIHRTAMDRV